MFTFGTGASGWTINVGSIAISGFSILGIMGGTNCLSASLGSLPLVTGVGERSPPPPPPAILSFFWGVGLYGLRSGAKILVMSWFAESRTGLIMLMSTTNVITPTWIASDVRPAFFSLPA